MKLAFSLADQNLATTMSVGIFNFSTGLLRSLLADPAGLSIHVLGNATLRPILQGLEGFSCREYRVPLMGMPGRLLWDQWLLSREIRRSGADWVMLPKGFGPMRQFCPARMAAYIHDVMPVVYEDHYPGSYGKWKQRYFQECYRATLRHASVIFTNTEFTAGEIHRWAGEQAVKPPSVVVAGYGFDLPSGTAGTRRDALVLLVRSMPHKRSDLALRYMDSWQAETGYKGELTILGSLPSDLARPARKNWRYVSRLDPRACTDLFQTVRCVIHFSEYEGFGMPPVEAILSGSTAVYSDIPPQREVMAGTGYGFDNESYEGFACAMDQALATPSATIVKWQAELNKRHNWSRVSRVVLETLGKLQ